MSRFRVRDRDAPITKEGVIFRVYGYVHPPNAAVCDVEYAPEEIYQPQDPRARRGHAGKIYHKFYGDGGLLFVKNRLPQYQLFYEPLEQLLAGLREDQIVELRAPDTRLQEIMHGSAEDGLVDTMIDVLDLLSDHTKLSQRDFGVFGSILHGFHSVRYSDIDLIVYGRPALTELLEGLGILYQGGYPLKNEFASEASASKPGHWRFSNLSREEYNVYQRRKGIYGVYECKRLGRRINVEFEPVKGWNEIIDEYDSKTRIHQEGWISAKAVILDDSDSYFMPAVYPVQVTWIEHSKQKDLKPEDIRRLVSYVEEFRGQAHEGEEVYVKGHLERVRVADQSFRQIALTYRRERYYDPVLKIIGDGV